MSRVLICDNWNPTDQVCSSVSVVENVYLFNANQVAEIDLLLNGGFSREAFAYGFGGVLTLFVMGLGVGIVVGMMRKMK